MNVDGFRSELWSYREDEEKAGRERRDSYHTLERLRVLYRAFDQEERKMADQVLMEWLLYGDPIADATAWIKSESPWWDAMVLIEEFKIFTALPALEELVRRLNVSADRRVKGWIPVLERKITALSAAGSAKGDK